tara:strand:- start:3812 stop:4207 length:396 start_codon:yes stop_codon:yes gene_type:complete
MEKIKFEDANLENIEVGYFEEDVDGVEAMLFLKDKNSGKQLAGVYGYLDDHEIQIGDGGIEIFVPAMENVFDTIDIILSHIVIEHSSLSNSMQRKLSAVFHEFIEDNVILDDCPEQYSCFHPLNCDEDEEY